MFVPTPRSEWFAVSRLVAEAEEHKVRLVAQLSSAAQDLDAAKAKLHKTKQTWEKTGKAKLTAERLVRERALAKAAVAVDAERVSRGLLDAERATLQAELDDLRRDDEDLDDELELDAEESGAKDAEVEGYAASNQEVEAHKAALRAFIEAHAEELEVKKKEKRLVDRQYRVVKASYHKGKPTKYVDIRYGMDPKINHHPY